MRARKSRAERSRRADDEGEPADLDTVGQESTPSTTGQTPAPPEDFALAGARGAFWQGLAQAVGKSVVLITTVALARILSPQEYGLVALALVLMAYAEAVADAGVAQALIYLPRNRESARAAMLVSVLTGCVLAAVVFLSATLIAQLFDHPDVAPLVRVLSLSLLATSLGAVPEALLRRQLRFQRLTVATVTRAVFTGVVTLILAVAGYGAWSLAIGTVAGSAAYATCCWLLLPERVPLRIWQVRKQETGEVVRYGAPVAGSTLLARLIFDVDYVIIGLLLGAGALGYYTLAFRLPEFIIINVFFVLASVMFPLYSRARNDPERLRRGYLKSVQIQSLYGVTAGVGLAVVASDLVPIIFGDKWLPAVVPLAILALYAAARSLGAGANEVYKAVGRPGLSIIVSVIRLVILVPVLVVAARWGIEGVAWAQLVVALIFAFGMQAVAGHVMQLRSREVLGAIMPALVCGAVVATLGLLASRLPIEPVLGMSVVVVVAIAGVAGVLRFGYRPLFAELLRLVRTRRATT